MKKNLVAAVLIASTSAFAHTLQYEQTISGYPETKTLCTIVPGRVHSQTTRIFDPTTSTLTHEFLGHEIRDGDGKLVDPITLNALIESVNDEDLKENEFLAGVPTGGVLNFHAILENGNYIHLREDRKNMGGVTNIKKNVGSGAERLVEILKASCQEGPKIGGPEKPASIKAVPWDGYIESDEGTPL